MAKVEIEKRNRVGQKGSSDVATLEAMFPSSPALPGGHQGQYDNSEVAILMKTLTNGVQAQNPDVSVDLDYGQAPDLATVQTGPGGLPGSSHTPAPGSPGPGSSNPRDIPAPPANHPRAGSSGAGSSKSPHESSQQIATQVEGGGVDPGNLTPGSSGANC